MKRFLVSALSFTLMVSLFTIPAGAASPVGQEHFTDGDYTFTKVSSEADGYAPLNDWSDTENEDTVYFSDGLLLMRNQMMQYSYLGEDGKLHDLNRGRFDALFPFSDGMAAVVSDNKVGYIDTAGNLVIPCQFDAPLNQVSSPYASSFENGTAWVFRYREGTDVSLVGWFDDLYGGWAQIDKTGKLLTDYSADAYVGHTGPDDSVYKQYNLSCPDSTGMGMVHFTDECTAPNIGTFNARFGPSDTGLTQLPTGKKDAYGQDETVLYVVKRGTVSNKTLPDIYIFDPGLEDPLGYTVTNNTGKQLTAHYALLSYWPETSYYPATEISPHEDEFFYGQLLSLDLDLAPGESIKGDCWAAVTGWSTMTHCWIQFDDKAERDAFFQNDALRLTPGAYLTGNNTFEIDHRDAGIQWMKDVLGIAIQSGKK